MIKTAINGALRRVGYEINSLSHKIETNQGLLQYKYVTRDGGFDYEQYKRVQIGKNKRDIETISVREVNIDFLARYFQEHLGTPAFGICHGAKHGREVDWFLQRLPGCRVIGTDISDNAGQFPHMVQWDFHEVNPEWQGAVDFIYTNALDHSYDPQKCIDAWTSSLRPGGLAVIEWHFGGEGLNLTDPFTCDIIQLVYAITRWGKGAYSVRELIPTPANGKSVAFVVIYKF